MHRSSSTILPNATPVPVAPQAPPSPWYAPTLIRWLCPPGGARTELHESSGARVLALPGRYCVNYLILGPEDVAVVDCGSAEDVPRVIEAVASLGRATSALRYVIPTHFHFDHMLGSDPLAQRSGARVSLGPVAARHVAGETSTRLRFPLGLQSLRLLPTWPMQGAPLLKGQDWSNSAHFGFPWSDNAFEAPVIPLPAPGEAIDGLPGWTVIETPGHADDAICLYHAEAGWLIAGDTLRNFLGGEWNTICVDPGAYARTRATLCDLDLTQVFPGHGPVFACPGGLRALPHQPWWKP